MNQTLLKTSRENRSFAFYMFSISLSYIYALAVNVCESSHKILCFEFHRFLKSFSNRICS